MDEDLSKTTPAEVRGNMSVYRFDVWLLTLLVHLGGVDS